MKQIFKILSDPRPHFIGVSERFPTSHPFLYTATDAKGEKALILSARDDYVYGLPVQLVTNVFMHMSVVAYHIDQAKPELPEPHVRPSRAGWDYQ